MNTTAIPEKRRKSVGLTKDEWKSLKDYRKRFTSASECADSIGIVYQVLDRVLLVGTGSSETIVKIRQAIA